MRKLIFTLCLVACGAPLGLASQATLEKHAASLAECQAVARAEAAACQGDAGASLECNGKALDSYNACKGDAGL